MRHFLLPAVPAAPDGGRLAPVRSGVFCRCHRLRRQARTEDRRQGNNSIANNCKHPRRRSCACSARVSGAAPGPRPWKPQTRGAFPLVSWLGSPFRSRARCAARFCLKCARRGVGMTLPLRRALHRVFPARDGTWSPQQAGSEVLVAGGPVRTHIPEEEGQQMGPGSQSPRPPFPTVPLPPSPRAVPPASGLHRPAPVSHAPRGPRAGQARSGNNDLRGRGLPTGRS